MTTSPSADPTLDPSLQSWVESANDPKTDFPIQNLPLCNFEAQHDGHRHAHMGVAIGDSVLDVSMLVESGFFERERNDEFDPGYLTVPFWNAIVRTPRQMRLFRERIQRFLRTDTNAGQAARRLRAKALRPIKDLSFTLPTAIWNYTDFYASIHHATTVGSMFRPDNPLLPNYKWVPIGYHGRASSLIASGADIRRPIGQTMADGAAEPVVGPCKLLDYELEVGCLVGKGNRLGEPISINDASAHIAGLCLVNDWSARDMQKWEYQPLGPFLAKNFATTVSPFLVTLDALAPFRTAAYARPQGDPAPLAYLSSDADRAAGGFDIALEVAIQSRKMRDEAIAPMTISRGRAFKDMYWTFAQLLTHHTSNGCNVLPGDLLASGTVSGPTADSRGCLLEHTWDGTGADGKPKPRKPITLPTGETRTFLADGDTVIMKGSCEREGFRRIGFGECTGTIIASI